MSGESTRPGEIALAVARIVLGVVFIMHGWEKYDSQTIDGVEVMFTGMDVPFPYASAVGITLLELVGGVALVLGALVRPLAIAFVLTMLGAIYYAHWEAGFFASDGGYELPLVLAVMSALLAVVGGGTYSVDAWLERGRTRVTSN